MTSSRIGDSPKRREDQRFVTGHGAYLDDLAFDGLAHATVLRSPHAHAWIRAIDMTAAKAAPGVLAVLTAADAARDGLKPLRPYAEANVQTGEPFAFAPQPLIAGDKVRFAGEPVALVIAETRAQALDAAELIAVDYEPIDAVTTGAAARAAGAPQIAGEVPGNVCIDWHTGDAAGADAAFARAAHVVTLVLDNHRIVTNPMEPRGGVGRYDAAAGRYTLHVSSQNIHINRNHVARALGVEPADVRFIAPDVGGGVQTYQYIHLQGSVYRLPAIALHVVAVLTNTAPIGVTRGPGFAETINILERLIDAAAQKTGIDRGELRRRNMVPPDAMPMTNAFGFEVDSGHFAETLDRALSRADCAGFAARRRASEADGKLRGLGFAYHIKGTGGPPEENVDVRFEADGTVSLITGTQHIGQGHETTFPQILAHRLGVANERIRLCQGDTDLIAFGGGHGSSRATYMGGTAIWRASDEIIAKGRALAADALEAAEADIRFEDGRFVVSGTDRAIGLLDVAALGREKAKPLDTYHFWKRDHMTFPNGAHVVEVEIDRETGRVALVRYTAVDDYGVLVNPMVASGQAHGAMAQGVGQALLEHATYDAGSGQMLAGSFMDYALPRADDLPSFDLGFNSTPCTTNPLGVKGCGEAGAIAAFPAIANAILDALAPLGVTSFEGPATPAHIWQAMEAAR